MILPILLSATLTFTATATGVEKGTPVEFVFAGPNTDRAYESMFLLDETVEALCNRIESAVPRGAPVDAAAGRLWPTGCRVRFEPSIAIFVQTDTKGESLSDPVFTGGTRRPDGLPVAQNEMPAAVFATYSLSQALIVYDNPLDQGTAYGRYTAAQKLEKGKKYSFTMIIDEGSQPRKIDVTVKKGNLKQVLELLKEASSSGDVDALVTLDETLSVGESIVAAQALSFVDSVHVKINGSHGLFYRAFLPLEKWRDRQERLHQPFELTVRDDGTDALVFIEEDWTVEGNDPKLTPHPIAADQAKKYPETDTCFIYASPTQTVARLSAAMKNLKASQIKNWYIFPKE